MTSVVVGLRKKVVDDIIMAWCSQYLDCRTATADLKGVKQSITLTRGNPQGGVLSPLIWNFNFDGLLQLFDDSAVEAVRFTDDLASIISGIDPGTIDYLTK